MNHPIGVLAEGIYDITIDWPVFISQLFGFAVIVFVFVKWIVPPVKSLMERSQETVRKQLEESEEATTKLAEAKQAYDSALAQAQAELEVLRADARADAEFIIAQMRDAAAAEVDRVRKQGRAQILQLRRQMIRDLETDLAAAMLELTEEKVRDQVSTPRAKSESIEKFLEDLEALANSGPGARSEVRSRWN
ncbi:F-type H+-transporting ATPase subunit delta [Nocardia transvalensis]|uniref:ATP synthase subunit b n=1 Tax=Nocardia transvalensis TaxID=37333 RepID=A0A7W9UMJ3_9NOCA|nr:ATP synthase F0F1 subunit delta [Nocardia transvalensis]MBB5918422.1 F-type H+-transporting ATPase subunit delta [Nocardia transvalensis]